MVNNIFFGYYPQSLKKEDITILSTFPDNDGYYLGSDGERYAKVVALKPSIFTHGVFIDGVTPIIKGNTYYFKVEPIEWKIEHKARKTYRVISDSLLDCPEFNSSKDDRIINNKIVYANNYEHSDVRKWLNNDFLNKAFTKEAQAYINTTNVDNSYISMGKKIDINNIYTCNDTIDKIFLPSVIDMSNSKYGYLGSYGGDDVRERYTTDYVRALGSDGSGGGTGKYMTRSPDSKSKDNIRVVAFNGDIHYVTDVNHYRNYENEFYEGFFAGVTPCMFYNNKIIIYNRLIFLFKLIKERK